MTEKKISDKAVRLVKERRGILAITAFKCLRLWQESSANDFVSSIGAVWCTGYLRGYLDCQKDTKKRGKK